MRLPRIPIWLPLAGLLLSFAGLSVEAYLDIAKALQDDVISRKTPDSLLLKKVFTSPVPAEAGDRYVRDRIIRDAIAGTHRNTLVSVYERKDDDRALIADNNKDIFGRVPKEAAEHALSVVRAWEAEGKDYRLAEGYQFEVDGIRYHLIGRRFPMSRSESSDGGEVLLVTNLDSTIAKTRAIFITAKLKTATVVTLWGIVAIVINVVPIVRLTRRLNQGQSLEVWWWAPKQIADLAKQLELDREANLRFRSEANAFRASIDLKSRMIDMSPVPTMICKLPKDGKQAIVTFANKAVATQFGYENIVGEPLNLLVPPEFGGYHTWASLYDEELGRDVGMAVCPHSGKSRVMGQQRPVPVISKMGVRLQALLSVERIADDDDGSRNFVGTLQDITPLVQAKEAAQSAKREAEEYAEIAKSTIDNLTDAIVFLKDGDGVYQLCNAAFAKIAGRNPIGLKDEDLAWTNEETAKYKSEDAGVLATGTPFSTLEQIIGQRWFVTRKVKVSILGKPSVLGVLLDVDELIKAKEEVERVNRISMHDIKADLTALNKATDVILETIGELNEYLADNADDVVKDAIETITMFSELNMESAANAFTVLDQRNKLYDLESKIEIEEKSVSSIVEALKASSSGEVGEFSLDNKTGENCQVLVDYSLFLTVLKNIVRNGFIHNESLLKKVSLVIYESDKWVEFVIADNGVGMPREYLNSWGKVLGKQAQLTAKGGSGTGLYSIKSIMDALYSKTGATIAIDSEIGKGSTFSIKVKKHGS